MMPNTGSSNIAMMIVAIRLDTRLYPVHFSRFVFCLVNTVSLISTLPTANMIIKIMINMIFKIFNGIGSLVYMLYKLKSISDAIVSVLN